MNETTIDPLEVAKFSQHAHVWWDLDGPLKTLHAINPARLLFVQKQTSLSHARVLDVGCGGGIFCEAMAQCDADVTGLDVEPDAIRAAGAHAEKNHLDIDYQCMPIEAYHAPLFDVITCMEMLEHVANPSKVIEHCTRLLKPGGYLCLSTIHRSVQAYASVVIAAEYILKLLPRQTHDFDKFIKPSELAHLCRANDMDVVDMAGIAYDPFLNTARLTSSVAVNFLLASRKL